MPVMRLVAMVAFLWAGAAAADLYRWVDPETGSVKYSNYPPPWYGNEARQRRAPKVERIPERARPALPEADAPAKPSAAATPGAATPGAAAPGAAALGELEAKRKQLLQQIAASTSDPPQLLKLIEEYTQLLADIDQKDPQGAPARRAETEAALEKLAKGTPK